MITEYSAGFDRLFQKLPGSTQSSVERAIGLFLDSFASRQFSKGLRVHRCGPFVSISLDMNHRIFLRPIIGGVRFVFVGNHHDAERYLKAAK